MDATTQRKARELQLEIAELENLITKTAADPHDPDLRWARDLFIYRMACCKANLVRIKQELTG